MKKTEFWVGVGILIAGVIAFGYGYMVIQNMYAIYGSTLDFNLLISSWLQQQWDLANYLQPIGLGILVLGVIMITYSVFVKE